VNAAVKQAVDNGNMCTLNPPAEVELADLLCEIHPWAKMARFARSGGETMSIAVRIARAFTQRDKVCICGYHGWSDWYVAANLSEDEALADHLLPGIPSRGVPSGLRGTVLPFHYNRIEELEAHAQKNGKEIAAIVMEPMRYVMPEDRFLDRVREIATRIGAVMILDEITIGWRAVYGGMHMKLGVEPDIACFAKSISNGYPMGAILGREDVMQAAQTSFISSTYWTEAIGPTAALATLRKMKAVDLPSHVTRVGRRCLDGVQERIKRHGLKAHAGGLPVLQHFAFDYGDSSRAVSTLMTQLMLERGFLATGGFYPTYAHTEAIVDAYLEALDESFAIIKDAVDADKILTNLKGPIAHNGFQRLT
jgi:glutamate-1-semialdehyde 2,1-aminomutase